MTLAGYSTTPLVKKLGIKAGNTVAIINGSKDFTAALNPLPEDVKFVSGFSSKQLDFILFFTDSADKLRKEMRKMKSRLAPHGIFWIAWPKKSSGVATDLSF